MRYVFILLTLGLLLAGPLAGPGHGLEIFGPQVPIGSWSQHFREHTVGWFDTLKVEMVSPEPSSFEDPVFLNFDLSDWTAAGSTPDYKEAWASGPKAATLQFALHFAGVVSQPLAFEFRAFEGGLSGEIRESALLKWSGSNWAISYNYDDPHCVAVVPLPGAVLLIGAGLARLMAYVRRYGLQLTCEKRKWLSE